MKKLLAILTVVVGMTAFAPIAQARHHYYYTRSHYYPRYTHSYYHPRYYGSGLSVSIGSPYYYGYSSPYYYSSPAYYAPPVYYSAPAYSYYSPYYYSRPYVGFGFGFGRHCW